MIRAVLFDWSETLVEYDDPSRAYAVPGALDCVRGLAGRYRLGILSNAGELAEAGVRLATRRAGFDIEFDVVVTSREAGASKPDSRIFAYAVNLLGCQPYEVVMVGDVYQIDVAGARAAGLRTVWFNPLGRGRGRGERLDDAEISSLDELPAALESLSGTPG